MLTAPEIDFLTVYARLAPGDDAAVEAAYRNAMRAPDTLSRRAALRRAHDLALRRPDGLQFLAQERARHAEQASKRGKALTDEVYNRQERLATLDRKLIELAIAAVESACGPKATEAGRARVLLAAKQVRDDRQERAGSAPGAAEDLAARKQKLIERIQKYLGGTISPEQVIADVRSGKLPTA